MRLTITKKLSGVVGAIVGAAVSAVAVVTVNIVVIVVVVHIYILCEEKKTSIICLLKGLASASGNEMMA